MFSFKFLVFILFLLVNIAVTAPIAPKRLEITFSNGIFNCVSQSKKKNDTEIKWYRNGQELIETDVIKFVKSTIQVQLTDVSEYYGRYQCKMVAINGELLESEIFNIEVERYLKLELVEETLSNASIKLDEIRSQNFHAKCLVKSFPPANVTFFHNGYLINEDDQIHIRKKTTNNGDLYDLVIYNLTKEDIGEYYCRANNGMIRERMLIGVINVQVECSGSKHWMCPDSEICVPKTQCKSFADCVRFHCEAPDKLNVEVKFIGYNKISLFWPPNENAMDYTIIADTLNSLSLIYETTQNFIIINGLKNNTDYTFSISAANKVGTSQDTNVHIKTKRMVPPLMVQNAKALEIKGESQSVKFQWLPPKDDGMMNSNNGQLKYKTSYCLYNNFTKSHCQQSWTSSTLLDVKDINYDTLYMFSVSPINEAGQSGPSKSVFYRTKRFSHDETSKGEHLISSISIMKISLLLTITQVLYLAG